MAVQKPDRAAAHAAYERLVEIEQESERCDECRFYRYAGIGPACDEHGRVVMRMRRLFVNQCTRHLGIAPVRDVYHIARRKVEQERRGKRPVRLRARG